MPPKKRKLTVQAPGIPKRKSRRLAAKLIKSIPKSEPIVYEKVTLTLADNGHAVYVELIKDPETREEWEFDPTREGYKVRNLQDHSEKQVEGKSFIRAAVKQFVEVLKTPNLHLKHLSVDLEPPRSICWKVEAAHKMCHPEDKEYKCKPPKGIKKLYENNSRTLLGVLEKEFKLLSCKLSVECFEMEFDGFPSQVRPVLSALQPTTLKKIVMNSDCLYSKDNELVNLEQWKRAEQLECVRGTSTNVKHWKHFKTVYIALGCIDKAVLDEILKAFLFLSTWEQISIQFRNYRVRRDEYFAQLEIPETTVIPGIVDNWVIEVPAMNHKVYVIYSDGTLHLIRKHWVANRKKKVPIRRKFRKAEAVFAELPNVLVRKVVKQLDEMNKRAVGQTSRFFNDIVRTTGSTYEKLTFTLADNRPAIFIELYIDTENRLELEFEEDPLGYTVKNSQKGWEQTVVYNQYRHGLTPQFDFIGGAVTHFLKIFTKKTVVRKLCLVTERPGDVLDFLNRVLPTGTLSTQTRENMAPYSKSYALRQEELSKTLLNLLSKKQHLLKVEQIEVHQSMFSDVIAQVLKFLDPMVLQRISLNGRFSEEEYAEIAGSEAWKNAKELYSSGRLSPTMWSHFLKSEVFYSYVSVERMEALFNALLVSPTWNSVLINGYTSDRTEQFLDRLEDQRPVESRIHNSKLIRIPNTPNQFINYQLTDNKISFIRVIQ